MAPTKEAIAAIRFGYGFHPDQVAPRDVGGLLASLAGGVAAGPKLGGPSLRDRGAFYKEFADLRARNVDNALRPRMKKVSKRVGAMFRRDQTRRTLAAVTSDRGFFERLSWFWTDHFAVGGKTFHTKSLVGRFEPDAIRPHIAGSFRDMLRASTLHPAMLLYLNQNRSIGPGSAVGLKRGAGLNENLAREIIELHTLGVGADYAQRDVRQFAELLTGLTFEKDTARQVFEQRLAEPGAETVLGESYGGDPAELRHIFAALDDLAAHPATARHIAGKLARHFVADEPSDGLVAHVEAAFNRSGGRLPAVYEALLEHPESWATFGAKVKQPFDFIVSSIRATGPTPAERKVLADTDPHDLRLVSAMRGLNQIVYLPPGPHGWPEETSAWITPQGLARRIAWASRLARSVEARIDPRAFVGAALRDVASEATTFAAARAAERWEGVALVLASPEFNRR